MPHARRNTRTHTVSPKVVEKSDRVAAAAAASVGSDERQRCGGGMRTQTRRRWTDTEKSTDRYKHTRAEVLEMFNEGTEVHSRGLDDAEQDTQDTFTSTVSG